MTLINDIQKKGNILEKNDLVLIQSRIEELKLSICYRLVTFGPPTSKSDLTFQYCKELKDIQKFLKKMRRYADENN